MPSIPELSLMIGIAALLGAAVVLFGSMVDGEESRRESYRVTFLVLFVVALLCAGVLIGSRA